jgi:hypothetical protein
MFGGLMERNCHNVWILGAVLGIMVCSTIVVAVPQQGWLSFGISADRMPVRSVLSDQHGRTVIEITVPGVQIDYLSHHGVDYQQMSLPYGGMTHQVGFPNLPVITELIAIPDQGHVRIRVIDVETTTIPDVTIYPFLEPPLRDGTHAQSEFVLDKEVYQSRKLYPSEWAKVLPPAVWRHLRVAPVVIQPMRWNPQTRELTVATRLQVEVVTEGTGGTSTKQRSRASISKRYAHMYSDRVINWNSYSGGLDLCDQGTLLIIAHDNFVDNIMPYADWKHRKGFPTTVFALSELGANPTPAEIKEFIQNAYLTWTTPPEYVVLVGDQNLVPWWTGVAGSKTDHPYSTLEGDDYFSDVIVARFSVETAAECDTLVTKLVDYERNPYLIETGWYDAGMVCASDEGVDPENGLKVRQILLNANFSIVDLFQEPQSNQASNLVNALNDGRSWAFYIGHGNATAWSSTTPYFTSSYVNNLMNGRKLPAVISIACANADLDYVAGDCFAETWMTTASDRGASNIMAFTENVAFFVSDTLGLGMMRSHFEDSDPYFGHNFDFGKIYMYQAFPEGPGGLTERTIQQAILLGDPTQLVWSDNPGTMAVNHPLEIPVGTTVLPVVVTMDGLPVEDAMVCAMMEIEGTYQVGMTDGAGMVNLPLNPQSAGQIELTITHQNALPYETVVTVTPASGAYVIHHSHHIDDSLGNANGMLDLGETVAIDLTMENVGIAPASNVNVLLRTSNPHAVFTDSTEDFGTILAGDSVTVLGGFTLVAEPGLEDGEVIGITVQASATGGMSWTSAFSITTHAPNLEIIDIYVVDQNGNGRIDPGENADLTIAVQNNGTSIAPDVTGILTSSSQFVTIETGAQNLGDLLPTAVVHVTYTVSASAVTPSGTQVTFALNLDAATGYNAHLQFDRFIGRLAAYLYEPDPTPISRAMVAGVLDTMGLGYEWGTTLPASLDQYASVWVFLGMWDNKHELTGTEGTRLADYLDGGGALYMEGGDTWVYDDQTAVHPYFHINGINDGWDDLSFIWGVQGSFAQGMGFGYIGENRFVDRIGPESGSQQLMHNINPEYGCGVSYDGGSYQTVGMSFEIGGLTNGPPPSSTTTLIEEIFGFFGITEWVDQFPPEICHQPLPDQIGEQGPYQVQATITDMSGVAEATLHYIVNGADTLTATMVNLGDDNYLGEIPGQSAGSMVEYFIEATDSAQAGNTGSTPIYNFLILMPGSQVIFLASDFENDDAGLTAIGPDWQWGIPSSGPQTAHSGDKVWATNLTGNYSPGSSNTLDTPPIDLRNIIHPIMRIWHWYSFESSGNRMWDGGNVKISVDGAPFEILTPVRGYDGIMDNPNNALHGEEIFGSINDGNYWHQRVFNLTTYQGHIVVIRFHMGSDGSNQAPGWYLDDLLIQGVVFGVLSPIDDLTIRIDNHDACLLWTPVTGAYQYRIYRSTDPHFELGPDSFLETADFHHYRDINALRLGPSFFYRVVAVAEYGVRGPQWTADPGQGNPSHEQSPLANGSVKTDTHTK